jgi:hypothetical protein
MAKKVFAVTNIKTGDMFVAAGEVVDGTKFTKDQLNELYDNGAVEIREQEVTEPEPEAPATEPEAEAPAEAEAEVEADTSSEGEATNETE